MVIDWDGKFIIENNQINQNFHIQGITMMISISNMAMVQLLPTDVERRLLDSFGILVEVQTVAR